MSDEIPEADAYEQRQDLTDDDAPDTPRSDDLEVPEADAYEQSQSVSDDGAEEFDREP